MRMNTKTVLAAALLMSCGAYAEPIANWQVLSGSISSTPTGLNTDSPVFGDGSANDFNSVGIGSLLGANGAPQTVSLDKVGDTLTASLDVTLIGGSEALFDAPDRQAGDIPAMHLIMKDGVIYKNTL